MKTTKDEGDTDNTRKMTRCATAEAERETMSPIRRAHAQPKQMLASQRIQKKSVLFSRNSSSSEICKHRSCSYHELERARFSGHRQPYLSSSHNFVCLLVRWHEILHVSPSDHVSVYMRGRVCAAGRRDHRQ